MADVEAPLNSLEATPPHHAGSDSDADAQQDGAAAAAAPDDASAAQDEPQDDTPSQAMTFQKAGDNLILSSTTSTDGTVTQIQQTPTGKKIKKIIRKKRRPARVQVDPATVAATAGAQPAQTGTIFNVWYSKWSGGERDDAASRNTPAGTRCVLARDTGYTRADAGYKAGSARFCMFFARGCCPRGRECDFLHRLPDQLMDMPSGQTDVFGRDKHADYRDDMGGVGSFGRTNRTLYVGRVGATDNVEEVVARHFSEWGAIERVRCLTGRGVAFVTYATEPLAQFAKEAMDHQSLDNEEVLNVRWATVDPNPVAQKREARAIERQAAEAIKRALPPDVVAELIGGEGGAKRRRVDDNGFGLEGYRAPDDVKIKAAREKQRLESAPQPRMIAGPESDGAPLPIQHAEPLRQMGLLDDNALAALSGAGAGAESGATSESQPTQAKPAGLVSYGDDDDDEW